MAGYGPLDKPMFLGASEYGGEAGLVQKALNPAERVLTPSEEHSIRIRAGKTEDGIDKQTGIVFE